MKIVITELNWPIGMELLKDEGFEVIYDPDLWKQKEALENEMKDAAALIVRNQTNVDERLLQKGSHLQVVGRLGVGLDNIDLEAAKRADIKVITAKNANAASVAEYVIAAMFHVRRPLGEAAQNVKAGSWDRRGFTKGELYGKTLGLVGTGETGLRAAGRAKALGMKVIGYDPFVKAYDYAVMETGIEMMELDQLLHQADFISLHVPLTPKTRYLIDRNRLKEMKPESWIINSSRGGVIEEEDLFQAIQNNEIGGAFLDVIEQEPIDPNHPLLTLENCYITPHIAGLTEEAQSRTSKMIAEEIIQNISNY